MNKNGFVKIYRSMLEWEWWNDLNTFRFFMFLLLKASFKDSKLNGEFIPAGSVILTLEEFSRQANLSVRSVRTALTHLKSTGEVTQQKTPHFTITTLSNYSRFQEVTQETTRDRQSTDKATTRDRQSTDTSTIYKKVKEGKECKNVKKVEEGGVAPSSALTQEQIISLSDEYGSENVKAYIAKVLDWKKKKGYEQTVSYATLKKWLDKDKYKLGRDKPSNASFNANEVESLAMKKYE